MTINSVGAGLLMLSYEEAKAGTVQAAGSYSSTEGSRVLASFNVDSYPGERDRIKELGLDLATAGLLAATAKLGAGAMDKLGAKLEKWWADRAVKEVKGANGGGNLAEVWNLRPTARGTAIESHLAQTEYKDWFNVGQLNNGRFPLVDFQNDNTLVSLKSIDTTGSTWLARMQDHIYNLGKNGATVNGNPAAMVLDLRVQPGGMAAAQSLIQYGAKNNVTVIIKEFK